MSAQSLSAPLSSLSPDELATLRDEVRATYAGQVAAGLELNLTRGKPSPEQLDLSNALLTDPVPTTDAAGTDVRNYGGLEGNAELRAIFGELLGIPTEQIIAGGNSSLTMMHLTLVNLLLHGGVTSERPWVREDTVRFICPVPGYDRHFRMLAEFGIDMVTVPMTDEGPDAEACAALAADDPSIKGMWIVPTYANPTAQVCSQEVAARLASMPTAAPDFTIFWDNAYALHHLTTAETKSADILTLASVSGHPHRPIVFASTSKITLAGAGVGFLGGSSEVVAWYLSHLGKGSIGPDKVTQLRHARFLGSAQGVRDHMARHREIIAPKFAEVERILGERLGGLGIATWTKPLGGYFVSLDVVPGTATRVVELAREAGVALTPAGSAFPHDTDPDDTNIRLAPTFPSLDDVTAAMEVVATCVTLAATDKLLAPN